MSYSKFGRHWRQARNLSNKPCKAYPMTYAKRGIFIRFAYLLLAMVSFAVKKVSEADKHKKIVLCYHGVTDTQKLNFFKQMAILQYRVVASTDLAYPYDHEIRHLPVCLTFDDAFGNLLSNVIPAITKLQIPITIFIPTGSLGKTPSWLQNSEHADGQEMVMSAAQIVTLKENSLVHFGSHTADHPHLSTLKEEEIRGQLRASKEIINIIVGEKTLELALPHGDYNEAVVQVALEEGYEKIYSLEPVLYDDDYSADTHVLGRFSVSPDDWPIEFYLTINGAYAWLAPWRSFCRKLQR